MILRRYGSTLHSVELNFDSKALNEIGFRRDHALSVPEGDFEARYRRVEVRDFAPRDEGWVQDETERALLDHLEREIRRLEADLEEGEVLVVENRQGVDHPKSRHATRVVVQGVENRLHFSAWVEPPLRLGRYRPSP
ncbi:MAG: hypothetical protein RQ751_07585 [Longimicrobiales bacterium]|nr:hypothetical protein [Longimicrobiales bacterium]